MSANRKLLPVLARAAELVGGAANLARKIDVHATAFYVWKKIPSAHVLAIEEATDGRVTRHELRPDLYPQIETALTASEARKIFRAELSRFASRHSIFKPRAMVK